MKVFIVTGEPFPNGMAAVSRIKCYARAMVEGGLDVEVVVYRRTEVYGNKAYNTERQGCYEGVKFRYVPKTTLRGQYRLFRHYIDKWDLRRADHYLKRNIKKGDVLFLFLGKPIEVAMRFMDIAHKKGAYCVRDLCELPYGTGAETEQAIRLRKKTIEVQFPRIDGIISISDALLNLAKTYTLPTCKHIKIPIMVDYKQYYLPDKSGETDIPYIFHAGTLYEQKDGILGMIEAFGKAVNKMKLPAMFISTGNLDNSPHKDKIRQFIAHYHLEEKLKFKGFISEAELKDYLGKASLVIINKYRTQQNNYCFSTKLGEYLAAAKPVIVTRVGEAMNWLNDGQSAYIVEPENTDELADAIVRVFTNPDESRAIGLSGQEVCRKCFDYRNWSQPLVDFMNQLGK